MTQASLDLVLIRRARAGERMAFDSLVLKYRVRLQKVVERFLRDPDDAQDVVQDAFVKAYLALPGFRAESSFYTWLCSIALNCARHSLQGSPNRLQRGWDATGDCTAVRLPEQLKDYATPEALALEYELAHRICSCMIRLPGEMRTVLLLREIDGLSYEQIANRTHEAVGTVRSRLFRARQAVLRPA